MTEPGDGVSLEEITAALRADSADVALYARVLTESLGDALPGGCVEVGVDHLGHVRAADPLHGLDLTGEPPTRRRVARNRGTQDLERDRPVPAVAGQEHDTHAALAYPVEQAVFPEPVRRQVLIVHGISQITEPPSVSPPGSASPPPG